MRGVEHCLDLLLLRFFFFLESAPRPNIMFNGYNSCRGV
jgi:hypothetical protein